MSVCSRSKSVRTTAHRPAGLIARPGTGCRYSAVFSTVHVVMWSQHGAKGAGGGVGFAELVAGWRAGVGELRELVPGVRQAVLLVPLEGGGLWTARLGGIRWVCGFSGEAALARFAARRGPGDRAWEYAALLGARILDEIVPAMGEPAGLAVDVASEGGAVFFPPVAGIVRDGAAVDVAVAGGGRGQR
jgi:hypothetical protein